MVVSVRNQQQPRPIVILAMIVGRIGWKRNFQGRKGQNDDALYGRRNGYPSPPSPRSSRICVINPPKMASLRQLPRLMGLLALQLLTPGDRLEESKR